jgi:hypothetical protein
VEGFGRRWRKLLRREGVVVEVEFWREGGIVAGWSMYTMVVGCETSTPGQKAADEAELKISNMKNSSRKLSQTN